jgi:hypothetical protein
VIRVVVDATVLVSAALARDPAAPSVRAFDALVDGRIEAAVLRCLARSPRFWGAIGSGATSRSTRLVGS